MDKKRCPAHGRLIQKDQFGAGHQSTSHHRHLLFPAADKSAAFIALFLKARKVVVYHLQTVLYGSAELSHMSTHLQVFLHGEGSKTRRPSMT